MDLFVDLEKLDSELTLLSDNMYQTMYLSPVEVKEGALRGQSIESYIQESQEMLNLINDYFWLLTDDIAFVRKMAETMASVDADSAGKVANNP